ncbi:hypothetical protein GXW82_26930 [Streptacidiphilus sp. 4-A2]|nr:hypothetical protein [Streptacidiphilus sp. 4-A2]
MSSRTDEQTDRARGAGRGRTAGFRAACAVAVSALVVAGTGPAFAAAPGGRRLPAPASRPAHATAPHAAAAHAAAAGAAAARAAAAVQAAAAARAAGAHGATARTAAVAPAVPAGVGARSRTVSDDISGTTLVTSGDTSAQPAAVSVIDVIMVAPTASRPGGTVDLRTFADCEGGATARSPRRRWPPRPPSPWRPTGACSPRPSSPGTSSRATTRWWRAAPGRPWPLDG